MANQPLAGIRVLEFGGYIAAPYATSLLCSLGADVIKVERYEGDDFRRAMNDRSAYFIQYNAGKRSLAVDLKTRDGLEMVKALIPSTDVVVENLRPGKLAALGLGPEVCTELRPDLVYASVTGFGNGGPLEQRAAYDTIGQAAGGLYTVLSEESQPRLSGTCLGDLIAGITTATGVLAALVGRGVTGNGQRLETSMVEAVSTLTIDAISQFFEDGQTSPSRQSRHSQALNFCLRTASNDYIAIHLSSSDKFWLAFVAAMNRPELRDDPRFTTYMRRVRNYSALVDIVAPEFARRPAAEWEKLLEEADVPFAPVLTIDGVINHPQTEWLQLLEEERNGVALVRPPWRLNGSRPGRPGSAPRVGAHTREVASEVYSAERIEELISAGVLVDDRALSPFAKKHHLEQQ